MKKTPALFQWCNFKRKCEVLQPLVGQNSENYFWPTAKIVNRKFPHAYRSDICRNFAPKTGFFGVLTASRYLLDF
jgi:hypothetical protein